MTPNNGSGHGRGQYASPAQVKAYMSRMRAYLAERNQRWLDRWQDRATGEFPEGVGELCNEWKLDNHLLKAAIREGWLDPASMPDPKGQKNRQIGHFTSIVYFRGEEGRRFVAFEAKAYLDRQERDQEFELQRKEASCP
jgi:hypothetical protein